MRIKILNKLCFILICVMILVSSIPVAASAASVDSVSVQSLSNNRFRIKGITHSDNIGKKVSMVVLIPNNDAPYTLSDVTINNFNELVCAADQGIVNKGTDGYGEYTFDIGLDENSPMGIYQVKCSVKLDEDEMFYEETLTAEFEFVSASGKQSIVDDVELYGATDELLSRIAEIAGLELSDYVNEKERIAEVINAEKSEGFDDFDSLMRSWYTGALLYGIENDSLTKEKFEDYLELIEIDSVLVNKCVSNYPEFIDAMGDVTEIVNINQLQIALNYGVIISDINSANRLELTDVLSEYITEIFNTDSLEKDYETYSKLSEEKKIQINAILVSNDYSSIDGFRNAFATEIDKSSSGNNGENTGNISSGSSGGRGGGSVHSTPTTNIMNTGTNDTQVESFVDVESVGWAKESIDIFAQKGIVSGYSDGTFKPHNAVTREEFVKLLVMTFDIKVSEEAQEGEIAEISFADVNDADWFYNYVMSAAKCGIVTGKSNETFGAGEAISRQDAATMIYRASQYKEMQLKSDKANFTDNNLISEYAEKAVGCLSGSAIINGKPDGSFEPLADITRAESVVMLYRIWLIM